MYRVGIRNAFEARHFLVGDFEEKTIPHSHRYVVDLTLSVESLDKNGFSVDIALLEKVLESILRELDNVLLNDLPFFKERQASVENSAFFIHHLVFARLAENGFDRETVSAGEVKIWESDSAWASYMHRGDE